MSEIQPSENDRQQRLAELQARLRRLTEERKAELRRSGPLPGDLGPPSAADGAQEQAVEPPAPVEAVAPAAPEMETDPVAPAVEVASEASTPQPLAPSPTAGPPADPQPSTPPPPEPLPVLETPPTMEASGEQPVEATPAAGTPRPSHRRSRQGWRW
jgi:hypothetical protein